MDVEPEIGVRRAVPGVALLQWVIERNSGVSAVLRDDGQPYCPVGVRAVREDPYMPSSTSPDGPW